MFSASYIKENHHIYVGMDSLRRLQFQARGFSFSPKQPANSILSGKNVSKLRGRGLNFEELRHYRPGDDIRSMDWKTTQRTGKPHIKVYTEERERNVYLVIDQRSNMFFGSQNKMKSVVAAELAALIAWRTIDGGDRVGALIYSDTDIHVVRPKRGRQHVIRLLASIVDFNQRLKAESVDVNTSESLNAALSKVASVVGNNALVMLIGDGYGWNDAATEKLKKVRMHNEVIACKVLDPIELDLPKMDQMIVSDGRLQIQISSGDTNIQSRYQQSLQSRLQAYQKVAQRYRVPLINVDTVTAVEKQLRKALGGDRS